MAEELAFQQAFGQGTAVDANVGARGTGAQVMNGTGDQLLARSGLADDQDTGARGCDLAGDPDDLAQALATADDPGKVNSSPARWPAAPVVSFGSRAMAVHPSRRQLRRFL